MAKQEPWRFLHPPSSGQVCCSDEEVDPEGSRCEQNVALKWVTETGSSIYATPLITDLYSDGHKDIIVPTFVHQLEVCLSLLSTFKLAQYKHDRSRIQTDMSL